ncbi:hypothetical protein ACDF64_09395 [Agromyces sp. MMS24-JH15]|uniref:hypothetical protein n=1 Tax=Agromyces sp. MMS24-JH15 TaxID=3243765 RepID=UPI003749CD6A
MAKDDDRHVVSNARYDELKAAYNRRMRARSGRPDDIGDEDEVDREVDRPERDYRGYRGETPTGSSEVL